MGFFVEKQKCDGCGECIDVCPADTIILENDKAYITIDCIECGECVSRCLAEAILFIPRDPDRMTDEYDDEPVSRYTGNNRLLIRESLDKFSSSPNRLVRAMLDYQRSTSCNYLAEEDLKIFAEETGSHESRVSSLASFYSLISTAPRGRFIIQVCSDIPCYVNHSVNVVRELEAALRVKMGQTTSDGLFTIEYSSCLGCCDKAPAMQIGDKLYGNLTSEKIVSILETYRRHKNE